LFPFVEERNKKKRGEAKGKKEKKEGRRKKTFENSKKNQKWPQNGAGGLRGHLVCFRNHLHREVPRRWNWGPQKWAGVHFWREKRGKEEREERGGATQRTQKKEKKKGKERRRSTSWRK
jgi:hypothetical protein